MDDGIIQIGVALRSDDFQIIQNVFEKKLGCKVNFYQVKYDLYSENLNHKIDFLIWDNKIQIGQPFENKTVSKKIPIILYIDDDHAQLKSAIENHPHDIWLKNQTSEDHMIESVKKLIEWNKWLNDVSKYQTIINVVPVSLLISDLNGNIEYVNPQFEKISGYTLDELKGQNPRLLKSGQHDKEFYDEIWSKISGGQVWEGEICNKNKSGEMYWERQMIVPFKDNHDRITHYIGLRIDDTDRRRAEEALRKAEALRSVKELAGGVAHEFSQPLQVLTITLSMLGSKMQGNDLFARCERMVQRIIELVGSLKNITELRQQDYLETKILDLKASAQGKEKIHEPIEKA